MILSRQTLVEIHVTAFSSLGVCTTLWDWSVGWRLRWVHGSHSIQTAVDMTVHLLHTSQLSRLYMNTNNNAFLEKRMLLAGEFSRSLWALNPDVLLSSIKTYSSCLSTKHLKMLKPQCLTIFLSWKGSIKWWWLFQQFLVDSEFLLQNSVCKSLHGIKCNVGRTVSNDK